MEGSRRLPWIDALDRTFPCTLLVLVLKMVFGYPTKCRLLLFSKKLYWRKIVGVLRGSGVGMFKTKFMTVLM